MYLRKNRLLLFIIPVLAIIISSCSSSRETNVKHGSGYNFKAGYPEFRMSAFGFVDENESTQLKVTTQLIKGSLIYKQQDDSLIARVSISIKIIDTDNPNNIISEKHVKQKITTKNEQINSSRESVKSEFTFPVSPSNYKTIVTVTDLNSSKKISQEANTYIPETKKGAYSLSSIQMYGKEIGETSWKQINTYDVKGKIDSLRFVFQIISPRSKKKMRLNSRLLRFDSDTSYTRPMHHSNYSPSAIEYKGIDYDKETELQSNRRVLNDYKSIFIEYKFETQERGNYRFEVTAQKGNQEEIYKGRDFGVKSKNYPAIQSVRELAKPLIYLMGEKDHKELMQISDNDSLKKEMDRFWLKNVGNAQKARSVIRLYYQRVEEANKQFSNFKEGWKTDPGMIYILFGSPWYTENHLKSLTWYYSYNHQDPDYTFNFFQPKLKNKYYPFTHYLLQRTNNYYTVQYMQRQLWLTGQILTRQL
ncbi:GWxTD domain-containing protein [Fodinibius saliphilus]|uniref:GWxTD domain-containing protein n=1 Tax=Fodinibius saliphilus TaxID=1920650 RepID=UPI0011090FE7|nr:GWxTD domain-containing protein [Fodinibius saliphilus]